MEHMKNHPGGELHEDIYLSNEAITINARAAKMEIDADIEAHVGSATSAEGFNYYAHNQCKYEKIYKKVYPYKKMSRGAHYYCILCGIGNNLCDYDRKLSFTLAGFREDVETCKITYQICEKCTQDNKSLCTESMMEMTACRNRNLLGVVCVFRRVCLPDDVISVIIELMKELGSSCGHGNTAKWAFFVDKHQ